MLIVKMWGGLGNQMFQYALFCQLQNQNIQTQIDTRFYHSNIAHNGYELENIFHITPPKVSVKDLTSRSIKKIIFADNFSYHETGKSSINDLLSCKSHTILKGYWQNLKYFKGIETRLLNDFSFSLKLDENNEKLLTTIRKSPHSVSLHVRRGDYLHATNAEFFHQCSSDYYRKAIAIIKERYSDINLYIFSDDMDWCQKNIPHNDAIFIANNNGINAWKDMYLMSQCKHNIIANSTFRWWGAWLNPNATKIVIAPEKWYNTKQNLNLTNPLIPSNWVQI